MSRITWAMLAWTVLWIVAVWAIDPASTVVGKPPSWALFEPRCRRPLTPRNEAPCLGR
jgi:hypothetical protein